MRNINVIFKMFATLASQKETKPTNFKFTHEFFYLPCFLTSNVSHLQYIHMYLFFSMNMDWKEVQSLILVFAQDE